MARILRFIAAGCAAAVIASPAAAQFGGGSLRGTTVALSVNAPMGDFQTLVNTGFGVAIRSGIGAGEDTWSGRGTFSFDRFTGNGTAYDNVQFVTAGFDIVHRSRPTFYQFAGLGLYNVRYTFEAGSNPFGNTRQEQDFGLTGGVGVNFGSGDGPKAFVEFAATTVFATGGNNAWFPVRLGMRF